MIDNNERPPVDVVVGIFPLFRFLQLCLSIGSAGSAQNVSGGGGSVSGSAGVSGGAVNSSVSSLLFGASARFSRLSAHYGFFENVRAAIYNARTCNACGTLEFGACGVCDMACGCILIRARDIPN